MYVLLCIKYVLSSKNTSGCFAAFGSLALQYVVCEGSLS